MLLCSCKRNIKTADKVAMVDTIKSDSAFISKSIMMGDFIFVPKKDSVPMPEKANLKSDTLNSTN